VKPFRPPSMRRVVIVVPSLFTLFNLFFGIWSMVLASRGEFYRAGWYIFFAGVLDALDGRVARLSRTGTRFGTLLALDPEPVVVGGPDGVDDGVIAPDQLRARDVRTELDAAEEPEAGLRRGLVIDARDRLDLRVIGRDAGAHQPERGRQRVDQVDLEPRIEQLIGRVEA